ncbi:histone-like nucleoid-structuring protein Lsr2 [Frankia sp. Cj3]|uniref:Lsr2 dimerization domain-containing protein n=1 Tax=Frankia sp. Cj3 TaxID=2880976 RepID=UPI001EF556E1|nr:histone-like nucleoid-structuring protein Lsr2 [Frankia sp. Cj3]
MAIKNYRVDDLDGTEGAEPHKLVLDSRTVAIDLSEENYGKLVGFLEPFFKAGTVRTAAGSGESETTKARAWLRENGHEVNDKGRIPDDKMALYRASLES